MPSTPLDPPKRRIPSSNFDFSPHKDQLNTPKIKSSEAPTTPDVSLRRPRPSSMIIDEFATPDIHNQPSSNTTSSARHAPSALSRPNTSNSNSSYDNITTANSSMTVTLGHMNSPVSQSNSSSIHPLTTAVNKELPVHLSQQSVPMSSSSSSLLSKPSFINSPSMQTPDKKSSETTRKSSFSSRDKPKVARSSSRGGFFSRFRRNNSTEKEEDPEENEQFKTREEGWNAGVFGFAPSFPTPPKYIWVHAHKKRNREFTRLFLAQELGEQSNKPGRRNRRRSSSSESDSMPRSGSIDSSDRKKAIWCAKFSPDGQFLATAGADCVIRIWKVLSDVHDRELFESGDLSDDDLDSLHQFAHPGHISTSSQASASSRSNRRTSLRKNPKTKKQIVSAPVFLPKPVLEYVGHSQDVLDICWSKNNFLLSSSMDKTVKLWHPQFSQSIKTFVHNDFVTSIAFHPTDDRFFLSGSLDCRVRLWSITENKVEYYRDAPDFVMAVAFSPDGSTAVAGCFGGQCIFYDTDGLRQKSQMIVKSTHGRNSNGSRITGIQILETPIRLPNLRTSVEGETPKASTFTNKSVKLLVSTSDSRVRKYNFEDKTLEAKYKGHSTFQGQIHAFFSDTGDYIISGSEDEKTYIWRTNGELGASAKTRESYEYFHSNKSIVSVALFAPFATRSLLYNSHDPIYDLTAPLPVNLTPATSAGSTAIDGKSGRISMSHNTAFNDSIKPNPSDGNIIITCDQSGVIKVFRQDSAHEKRKLLVESLTQKRKPNITPTSSLKGYIYNNEFNTSSNNLRSAGGSPSTSPNPGRMPRAPFSMIGRSGSRNRFADHSPIAVNRTSSMISTASISTIGSIASNQDYQNKFHPTLAHFGSQNPGSLARAESQTVSSRLDGTPSYSSFPGRSTKAAATTSLRNGPLQSSHWPRSQSVENSRTESPASISSSESLDFDSFSPRKIVAQALGDTSGSVSPKSGMHTSDKPATRQGQKLQEDEFESGQHEGDNVNSMQRQPEDFLKCKTCGSVDFKVRAINQKATIMCKRCGAICN